MAFWDAEIQRLNGFGKPIVKKSGTRTTRPASSVTSAGQGPDPNAIAASIPEDVKKPVDVLMPPPSKDKTKQVLAIVGQTLQNIKGQTDKSKQAVAQVKQVTSKLKGFFGFGAANVAPSQKVAVTQQNKKIADQAVVDARQALNETSKVKAVIAQHKADLLKDKSQIANEKIKIKQGIAKKQERVAYIKNEQAKIPATITK